MIEEPNRTSARLDSLAWAIGLVAGVIPLWVCNLIPAVDMPQHLHMISIMTRLQDPTTLYPEFFALRPGVVTYLGYYYLVIAFNTFLPLELANRVVLSLCIVGLPLAMAFLLRSFRRPAWPALMTVPLAYGDTFAWGFVNVTAAIPLAFVACGAFVRCIADGPRRWRWAVLLAIATVGVLLCHVQVFIFLGFALPFLLFTTRAPDGGMLAMKPRLPALVGLAPSLAQLAFWADATFGKRSRVATDYFWNLPTVPEARQHSILAAIRNALDSHYVKFTPFIDNLHAFIRFPENSVLPEFPLLAGMLNNDGDQTAMRLTFAVVIGVCLLGIRQFRAARAAGVPSKIEVSSLQMLGLSTVALALYFLTPFEVTGYINLFNQRFASIAGVLLVCSVPVLTPQWARRGLWAGLLVAIVFSGPVTAAFRDFDVETRPLLEIVEETPQKPKLMGMIYDWRSWAFRHALMLQSPSYVAMRRGGITSFSFALQKQVPVMYRDRVPPVISEWRPTLDWPVQGPFYDTALIRGPNPAQVFGGLLDTEVETVTSAGSFSLVRKR